MSDDGKATVKQKLEAGNSRTFRIAKDGAGYTVKHVCYGCNNGWLGSLENRVARNLKPIIQGETTPLAHGDRRDIGAWAMRFALALDLSQNRERLVPDDHARWLRDEGRPGPNALVILSGSEVFQEQIDLTLVKIPSETPAQDGVEGYGLVVATGHLIVIAVGFPFDVSIKLVLDPAYFPGLVPIWPSNPAKVVTWPPLRPFNDTLINQFINGIIKHWSVIKDEAGR